MHLVVFGGPNGSGKTSLWVLLNRQYPFSYPTNYLCPDDIVNDPLMFPNITDSEKRYRYAARYVEELRGLYIKNGIPFILETVMSHNSKLDFMQEALSAGYFVELIYVTTADPSINLSRIAKRVSQGGHDVPSDKVYSRYERSMRLAPQAIKLVHNALLFDNTVSHTAVLGKEASGTVYLLNREKRLPEAESYLQNRIIPDLDLRLEAISDLNAEDTRAYMVRYQKRKIQ